MKISTFFNTRILALFSLCLVMACTKYAAPDTVARDVASRICGAMDKCREDGGSYTDVMACMGKLTAEIETYQQVNDVKMTQDDYYLCTSMVFSCADFKQNPLPVPTGCESLSGWFNK